MKRCVMVTGCCGNIGTHVVDALLLRGYTVRGVDLPTTRNRETASRWDESMEMRFGSICDERHLRQAMTDVDDVIHLAAIVPPATDVDQALGYSVNVLGTKTVIASCEAQSSPPRLTFTSTAAIWGDNDEGDEPRRADEPICPSDNYTRQKAECEELLRASALDSVVFRIAMTPPVTLTAISPFVFDMHPDLKVEFTHPRDQALGIINSLVLHDEVVGRTLLLGGGERNRYRYREWLNLVFTSMGLPSIPRSAFGDALFLTDWVDSEASQAILDYQRHTLDDYLEEIRQELGPMRHVVSRMGPALVPAILAYSRHQAMATGKNPTVPNMLRAITTLRRGLEAAKSYL
ncbi:MAG: NAD(P)-dependent oxidoreductase [Polyangiales bacterium]